MTRTAKVVSATGFTSETAQDVRKRWLGFVSRCFADRLLLLGLVPRRAASGRHAWHARRFRCATDGRRGQNLYNRLLNDRARRLIEDIVFAARGIVRNTAGGDRG